MKDKVHSYVSINLLHIPTSKNPVENGLKKRVLMNFRFSVSLAYYGISFSIPDLSGDRYLNFMIGKLHRFT